MTSLNLGEKDHPVLVDAQNLITGVTVLIAPPGSGKSNTVSVICEELLAQNFRFAIIDSEGEYRNIAKLGGIRICDDWKSDKLSLPLKERLFERILSRAEEKHPLILDLSQRSWDERVKLVDMFLKIAFDKIKSPYLLIVDESTRFASPGKPTVEILKEIQNAGRKRGLGLLLITQKILDLSETIREGCTAQIVGGLKNQADIEEFKRLYPSPHDFLQNLSNLRTGEFYFCGKISSGSKNPTLCRFRTKQQFQEIVDKSANQNLISKQAEPKEKTLEELRQDIESYYQGLEEVLENLNLNPSRELEEFLQKQKSVQEWGSKIDYHVVLPQCYFLHDKGFEDSNRNYAIKKDDHVTIKNSEQTLAQIISLEYEELEALREKYALPILKKKYEKRGLTWTPENDDLKLFVSKINTNFLDGIGKDKVLEIHLLPVRFSTIVALKEAMSAGFSGQNIETGRRSFNFHKHILSISTKTDLPRSVFVGAVGIHLTVISEDNMMIFLRRSNQVYYHPGKWTLGVDEVMKGDEKNGPPDKDFLDLAIRGLQEEMGLYEAEKPSLKILAFAGEYDDLEFSVHGYYMSRLTAAQIEDRFRLLKAEKLESDALVVIPADLESLTDVLINGIRNFGPPFEFHPDGPKLGILLYLLQKYGLDSTKANLKRHASR